MSSKLSQIKTPAAAKSMLDSYYDGYTIDHYMKMVDRLSLLAKDSPQWEDEKDNENVQLLNDIVTCSFLLYENEPKV